MTTKTATYPMRLPLSLKAAVVGAVAEKLSAMATADQIAGRRALADMQAFDRSMNRDSGEPPRPDDLL